MSIAPRSMSLIEVLFLFFFFQAEDGIRDLTVTGVQTCALPISAGVAPGKTAQRARGISGRAACGNVPPERGDRKSTRLNSSHSQISYAVFCLKKKKYVKYHHGGRKTYIPTVLWYACAQRNSTVA